MIEVIGITCGSLMICFCGRGTDILDRLCMGLGLAVILVVFLSEG